MIFVTTHTAADINNVMGAKLKKIFVSPSNTTIISRFAFISSLFRETCDECESDEQKEHREG